MKYPEFRTLGASAGRTVTFQAGRVTGKAGSSTFEESDWTGIQALVLQVISEGAGRAAGQALGGHDLAGEAVGVAFEGDGDAGGQLVDLVSVGA